jgi:putative zinc-binding metallo-peptidase
MAATPRKRRGPEPAWASWSDEKLMQVPICELGVQLQGSEIEAHVDRVRGELERRALKIRPNFWLSDEWFTPMGLTGVAVPFYLAHPRLARLEKSQMLEVEGGTPKWALKILRHEVGHVVDNAFKLRRRRRRQQLFGKASTPYPETYLPKPYSKSFVQHLDQWYAQSHPDEDFAETFAVWLTPSYPWRKRYSGWKALAKLEYMDELMGELAGQKPQLATRRTVDPIEEIDLTLGQYYAEKRERYAVDYPKFYDRDLRRLFVGDPEDRSLTTATSFIRRHRKEIGGRVSRWTGTYRYTIKLVLDDMLKRSKELGLRLGGSEEDVLAEFTVLMTVQTMNYVLSGRHKVSL